MLDLVETLCWLSSRDLIPAPITALLNPKQGPNSTHVDWMTAFMLGMVIYTNYDI